MSRPFRKTDSFEAESKTRASLASFLRSCGLVDVQEEEKRAGNAVMQTMRFTDDKGISVVMSVRLCWRKRFEKSDEGYAAFQPLFKVKVGTPEDAIRAKLEREAKRGKTHWLIVQRDEGGIVNAMMIPLGEVLPIWIQQKEIYQRMIGEGKLGARNSNPAVNGASPALYLQDDRAPAAVEFLFSHPAVRILSHASSPERVQDDTYDDLPTPDSFPLGSDGAPRYEKTVSGVKRDPAVRRAVIVRARSKCEHCGDSRPYIGFLDVHHILGAEKSDRVWNCVALCPNCHRDAHFSADRDSINAALLDVAAKQGGEPSMPT